jgi:serine/threonine protein kinase
LIDFGEALHIGDEEVHDNGVGTPHYVAPEIVDNKFPFPRTGKVCGSSHRYVWCNHFYMCFASL